MATPAIFDKLQKVPTKTRAIVFFVFVVIALVVFIWLVHIPKTAEIKKLDAEIAKLQTQIAENDAKIRQLDQLRAEVKTLHERLQVLTEQLPPENEVSGLLRQVAGLVSKSGLSLKHWKPDPKRKPHSSGLYEEIPISIALVGGYHNVAMFFDSVSKLTRIVNMKDVKMTGAKVGKNGQMEIVVGVTALTFAAVEKKAEPVTTPKSKTPAAKKTK